MKMAKSPTVEK